MAGEAAWDGKTERRKNADERDKFQKHLTVSLRALEIDRKRREEQAEKDKTKKAGTSLLDW